MRLDGRTANMVATLVSYLRSGRIGDLPLRLWILGGLTSLAVALMAARPVILHLLYYCLASSIYLSLVVAVFFGLMFSLFAPLIIGHRNANCVRAWSGNVAVKAFLWVVKACFLFTVNTTLLFFNLFLAAVSPGDVATKAGEALSHYIERSADMLVG